MNTDEFIPGMRFVLKHELTRREINTLLAFFNGPLTTPEAAHILKVNKVTLHHSILSLKHKGLLVQKSRNKATNAILYRINGGRKNDPREQGPDPRPESSTESSTESSAESSADN